MRYLEDPPTAEQLLTIARMLDLPVADLLRTGEAAFKDARDLPERSNDGALAEWLARNPIVIERPIVVDHAAGKAVIGRPPENVMQLLGQ